MPRQAVVLVLVEGVKGQSRDNGRGYWTATMRGELGSRHAGRQLRQSRARNLRSCNHGFFLEWIGLVCKRAVKLGPRLTSKSKLVGEPD